MTREELHLLIDKELAGTATDQEKQQLLNLTASFQDLGWDYTVLGDPEQTGQRIYQKIKIPRTMVLPVNWIRAVAAAVLLLAGLGTYRYFVRPVDPLVSRYAGNTAGIRPGRQGGTLILADGRQFILDSLNDGLVATDRGTDIMLQEGQLAYNPQRSDPAGINTVTTPRGRQFKLILPDGSRIWLNAASSVRFPTAFNSERIIHITGEAYLEVAEDKSRPFKIDIDGKAQADVLGTSFNINSYPDEGEIRTTLLEGSIRLLNGRDKILLRPGQQATVSSPSSLITVTAANADQAVAWKNGMFNFKGASLQEVMRQLARWYDLDVEYRGTVTDRRFVGKLSRDFDLKQILRVLEKMNVHFMIEGRKIIVTSG